MCGGGGKRRGEERRRGRRGDRLLGLSPAGGGNGGMVAGAAQARQRRSIERSIYDTIAEHVAARHTTAFRCGGKQWSLMLHCCMQGMVRGEDCKGVKRVGFIVEVILFLIVSIMEEGRKMKIHKNWWQRQWLSLVVHEQAGRQHALMFSGDREQIPRNEQLPDSKRWRIQKNISRAQYSFFR